MGKHIRQKICEGGGWLPLCASSVDFNDDPVIVDVSMSAATVQITAADPGKGRYVTVDALASAMAAASAHAGLNAELGLRLVDNFAVGRLSAMALVPITATAANLPP